MSFLFSESPKPNHTRALADKLNLLVTPDLGISKQLGLTLVEDYKHGERIQEINQRLGKPTDWNPLCYHWAFKDEPNFRELSRAEPPEENPQVRDYVSNDEILPKLFPHYNPCKEPESGDIVAYSKPNGHIVHFGIYRETDGKNKYIESKWGGGHVWLHPLMTLPSGFGNTVQYYSKR